MLTKKEFCEATVREEMASMGIENFEDAHNHIYASSTLAVCLEYLGVLTPEEKEYSSTRGGVFSTFEVWEGKQFKDVKFLTVREIISLLPENMDEEKN